MASLAPTPPPPGTSSSTSPTSEPAHGPMATLSAVHPQVSLSSQVPDSSPSLQPQVGRSKGERWRDANPSSSAGGSSSAPTFREVLLSGGASSSASPLLAEVKVPPPSKVVLMARPCQVSIGEGPDASGWQRYESRHARKKRLKESRGPRRRIPEDLKGRCFNCFATSHRAAVCCEGPRCFKCHETGHRASSCVVRGQTLLSVAPRGRLVWQPKAALGDLGSKEMVDTETTPSGDGSGAADDHSMPARRH